MVAGHPIENPETVATAIRIGNPASYDKAIAVREASKGAFNAVTDEEILAAYSILAGEEGVFCEPASAASVAGLLKVKDEVPANAKIVCVLTGNGMKDPQTAIDTSNDSSYHQGLEANLDTVAKVMGF